MSNDIKDSVIVTGELRWSNLTEANDDEKFTARIGGLSKAAIKALNDLGIPTKDDNKGEPCLRISHTKPIKFTIKGGDSVGEGEYIAAGTKVVVEVFASPWEYKNKKGISAKSRNFTITKLVTGVVGTGAELDESDAL